MSPSLRPDQIPWWKPTLGAGAPVVPPAGAFRGPALSLAIVVAVLLIVGGVGLLVQVSWWPTMKIAAAGSLIRSLLSRLGLRSGDQ